MKLVCTIDLSDHRLSFYFVMALASTLLGLRRASLFLHSPLVSSACMFLFRCKVLLLFKPIRLIRFSLLFAARRRFALAFHIHSLILICRELIG